MLKLRRLKINRYRNVKPCELNFAPGCNAVIGLNGSGKTTLLKLIAELLSKPIGSLAPGETFDVELEFELATSHALVRLRRDLGPPNAELRSKATRSPGMRGNNIPEEAQYTADFSMQLSHGSKLRIEQQSGKLRLQLNDEQPVEGSHSIEQRDILSAFDFAAFVLARENLDETVINSLTEINQLQLRASIRFDEALGYFDSIEKNLVHRTDIMHREFYLEPESSLPVAYHAFLDTQFGDGKEEYVVHDQQLDFLGRFVQLTRLKSAQLKLERIERKRDREKITVDTYGNSRFSFTRRDGSIFPQDHLSYGQKRLLAFLYYLAADPMVIIADELADGMHYAWLEVCIDAIGDRQAILASQNPLVFDHLTFTSAEQVQSSLITCQNVSEGDRDVLVWRNFNREEAEAFFRAYQAEVQHISEILQTEGLW